MPRSREERYMEWLERLEIPIENTTDIDTFQNYLLQEFDITLPQQIEALWETQRSKLDEETIGITPVIVEYPWGKELRYGVQGLPGLWGFESVRKILEEERG